MLSAANWGGQPLHPRGNYEGFFRSASKQKWLEVHGIEHWTHYYTDYGVDLQKRFFDFFLKGKKNGWDKQPRVQLNVRHPGEKFVIRHEDDWPIPRTQWTKFHLAAGSRLAAEPPKGAASRDVRRQGRRYHFPDRADAGGDRDHRPGRRQAGDLLVHRGRRPVSRPACVRAGHEGGDVPGRARSAHADRPGLAARLAPRARQEAHPAVPALPHPPEEAAAQARRGLRGRDRDRADLHRGAEGLSRGPERARARLRLSGRLGRPAVQHEERVHRQRPVPARRPARPPDGDLRRRDHHPPRRRQGELRAAADHPREGGGGAAEADQPRRQGDARRGRGRPPAREGAAPGRSGARRRPRRRGGSRSCAGHARVIAPSACKIANARCPRGRARQAIARPTGDVSPAARQGCGTGIGGRRRRCCRGLRRCGGCGGGRRAATEVAEDGRADGSADETCGAACGGIGGLRAGAAAACGGDADVLCLDISTACSLAMSRDICSWRAASCSTLWRKAPISRATVSSCCWSGDGAAGAAGAAMFAAVCSGAVCATGMAGGVSVAAGAMGAACAAAGCGADASNAGAEAACPVAAAGPGAWFVTGRDEIQASCGTLFAIISLAAPP